MKKFSILAMLLFSFSACTPDGRVFSDNQVLSPEIEWHKADVKTFQVPLVADKKYNVAIAFRFANGFPFRSAMVNMEITSPSGETSSQACELVVRQENGDYIGEAGFDIWDSEHQVLTNHSVTETGNYTFKLSHAMAQDPLNFAMEIGLLVDEVLKQ
jgi:gliding motility-associated lipoprotein GldH